jgi:transcriptional regulator with XRE-family HTH domain
MTSSSRAEDDDWVGRYVVRVRRLADLSQRDLAVETGTSASRICRLESGAVDPGVTQFQRILALAGLRLAVVDEAGHEVAPVPADIVRDNQGRRFPAHLDVAPPDEVPYDRWAFPRYDRPEAQGWYHLRDTRDELAVGGDGGDGAGGLARPADHPTRTELRTRRRLMRGRQPCVDAPLPPDVVCGCPEACFELACVPECPCQCEPPRNELRRRQLLASWPSPADAGAHLVELGEEGEVERPS